MLSRRTRQALLMTPAVAAFALTSACGASGYGTAPNGSGNGAAAPQVAAPGGATQQQGGFSKEPHQMLSATESKDLGWYVADAGGFALYRFDQDTAKPSKSNCEADCSKAWLPVLVSEHTMTSGVDPTLVGEVARSDGKKQVTLAGWPLYRFPGDKTAGQTTGQGKGGTWWVVTPEGKKAQSDAPATASGNGY